MFTIVSFVYSSYILYDDTMINISLSTYVHILQLHILHILFGHGLKISIFKTNSIIINTIELCYRWIVFYNADKIRQEDTYLRSNINSKYVLMAVKMATSLRARRHIREEGSRMDLVANTPAEHVRISDPGIALAFELF